MAFERYGSKEAFAAALTGGVVSQFRSVPKEGFTIRILEEPERWIDFYQHWNDKRPYVCTRKHTGSCVFCDEGISARRIFITNAVVIDEGETFVASLNKTVVEQLVNFYNKYGSLRDRDYTITKTGMGINTKYFVVPEDKDPLDLDNFQLVDTVELLTEEAEKTTNFKGVVVNEKRDGDNGGERKPLKKKLTRTEISNDDGAPF